MKLSAIQYAVIGAYLLFIFVKGIRRIKDIHESDDFLVAGRDIGWFFLLCTMGATVVGGGASIGAVGKTFEWGLLMVAVSSGWYLHFIVSGLYVAPRFREARLYTVAGYFGLRFDEKARFVTFILSLVFSIGVLGAQMVAFGKILETVIPGVPYFWAVIVGGMLVTVYSTAGGLKAVIHTDVYQFVVLLLGFFLTLSYCVPDLLENQNAVREAIPAEFFQLDGGKGTLFLVTTFLAFFLGETFSPAYATRYCVGKDVAQTKIGIVGAGVFLALVYPLILFFIAMYARLHFPDIDSEEALPRTLLKLNSPLVGALMVAALLSAVMSSADSVLNSATAIFVKDFYEKYLSRASTDENRGLRIARWSTVVLGGLGIGLALVLPNVIDLLLLTYTLWAPGIILPVFVGVFSKLKNPALNRLIFYTMVLSTAATGVFMTTEYAKDFQPSIFGVACSCLCFAAGGVLLRPWRMGNTST